MLWVSADGMRHYAVVRELDRWSDDINPNTIVRSEKCQQCGARMLWTQNVWPHDDSGTKAAAYQCDNGHRLDPATTRQCPSCGVHDTRIVEHAAAGQLECLCNRCGVRFHVPR